MHFLCTTFLTFLSCGTYLKYSFPFRSWFNCCVMLVTVSFTQSSNNMHNFSSTFFSYNNPKQHLKENLTGYFSCPTSASIQPIGFGVGTIFCGCFGNVLAHSAILISFHASWYVYFSLSISNFYRGSLVLKIHGCWLTSNVDASPPVHTPPLVTTTYIKTYFPLSLPWPSRYFILSSLSTWEPIVGNLLLHDLKAYNTCKLSIG